VKQNKLDCLSLVLSALNGKNRMAFKMNVKKWWIRYCIHENKFNVYTTKLHAEASINETDKREQCCTLFPVIDATGMPSKEELRKYCDYVMSLAGFSHIHLGDVKPDPELMKVRYWLESLAAE
jgi:hypothetical protein